MWTSFLRLGLFVLVMTENTHHIKVIDSPTGSGKTSYAIEMINAFPAERKVIYITPLLSEVNRIIASCPNRRFTQPDPRYGEGRKMVHLLRLVREEKDIVSTHSLFSQIGDELITALRNANYVLILDEVFGIVEKFDMWDDFPRTTTEEAKDILTRNNVHSLLGKGFIQVAEDYRIQWIDHENPIDKYRTLKRLVDRDLIYLVNHEKLFWTFPVEVFSPGIFAEIYILTFQFQYQLQSYYYHFYDVPYDLFHITKVQEGYTLIPTVDYDYEREWKEQVRPLISIVDNAKLNRIGDVAHDPRLGRISTSLSKNWYKNNPGEFPRIRKNIVNFFVNFEKVKSSEKAWTCFLPYKQKIKGTNLSTKSWIPLNCRATNEYAGRRLLAYPINRYIDPFLISFFSKKDIHPDIDGFALSEMIQWVWRSAIRTNQNIALYIPSERMRTLFQNYFNDSGPIRFL